MITVITFLQKYLQTMKKMLGQFYIIINSMMTLLSRLEKNKEY